MLLAKAANEMFIKIYLLKCVFAWIHHTEFDLIHGDSHYYEKWFDIDDHKIYLNKGRVKIRLFQYWILGLKTHRWTRPMKRVNQNLAA